MPIISSVASASARGYGFNGNIQVPGNSGVLTSGTSYTLPLTSGTTVNILVIGGGGGGGGGAGRVATYSGFDQGGGGGGQGGNAYALNVPVVPGQTISISIGAGGTAGTANSADPPIATNGGQGGSSTATVVGTVAFATGGNGGYGRNPGGGGGGSAGGVVTGTQLIAPSAGSSYPGTFTYGGAGAAGYVINTTVGISLSSILTSGSAGLGAIGYPLSSGRSATAGTTYGGGAGGGCSAQTDRCFEYYCSGTSGAVGSSGAVFIWWGYGT